MKNLYRLFLACAFACILFGCSKNELVVDYLPVKADKGENWGFINAKGEVFLADEFENKPSAVIEGVFSVQEGDTYTLYSFDEKKPKALIEDLVYVGVPDGGMLPITKKDCKIEVVNTKGETLFTLDEIDGGQVYVCDYKFNFDYLIVGVKKGNEHKIGLVNRKGETVLKPKYDDMRVLSEDLILVTVRKDDDVDSSRDVYFINSKGEKQKTIKFDKDCDLVYWDDDYIAIEKEDRIRIFNFKGEEIYKCKDDVKAIWEIKDDKILFSNDEGQSGVMDIKGERILAPKFDAIFMTDDGYFVNRDGKDEYEYYNSKGEKEISTDWKGITYIEGFGYLAYEDINDNYGYQYIIDEKGVALHKNDMFDIATRICIDSYLKSDFFSAEALAELMVDAVNKDLSANGVTPGGLIANCKYEQDELKWEGCSYKYDEGLKYEVKLYIVSDRDMKVPVYGQRAVQRYSYSHGYYTDYERYVERYEVNPEACARIIGLEAKCPADKRNSVYDMINTRLNKSCSKISNDCYKKGAQYIVVVKDSDNKVSIAISNEDITSLVEEYYTDYDEAEVEWPSEEDILEAEASLDF